MVADPKFTPTVYVVIPRTTTQPPVEYVNAVCRLVANRGSHVVTRRDMTNFGRRLEYLADYVDELVLLPGWETDPICRAEVAVSLALERLFWLADLETAITPMETPGVELFLVTALGGSILRSESDLANYGPGE